MKIVCIRPISIMYNGARIRRDVGVEFEVLDSIAEFLIARGDAKPVSSKEEKSKASKSKKVEKQVEEVSSPEPEMIEEVEAIIEEEKVDIDAISSEL